MKIIAVGMNYALHNKELGHTHENKEPVIFLKPDSAILKDGKPFFIPDFSNEVHYETEVVVRICRLTDNFRVHQVCQTNAAGSEWGSNGNHVHYFHVMHLRFTAI